MNFQYEQRIADVSVVSAVLLAKQTNSLENGSGHIWAVARENAF